MNIKKLICLSLCAAAVLASVLTACNSDGATPDEASTATTVATTTVVADANTTATATDAPDKSENETDAAAQNGNSNNSDSNSSGGSSGSATKSTCIVTVGGKDYTVKVGDTVTYSYYLTTPKPIENVQASLTYDGYKLKVQSTDGSKMFPVLGTSAIFNTELSNTIKFNASNISGYDFTTRAQLITVDFKVIGKGNTSVATAIEIMDEKGGNPYVSNFKISGDVTCEEVLR